MRDDEFQDELERLTPKLHRLLWKAVRTFKGDPALEVEDLLQDTADRALHNSRLPQYDTYTCERLLFEKAYNIIYEYRHPSRIKVPALSLEEVKGQTSPQDPYQDLITRQWLERIYKKVKRKTWIICFLTYAGYKQEEIAAHLGMDAGAVKMRLNRVRKDLTGEK